MYFNRKLNQSVKGCLGSKKSALYDIPREMNSVQNLTQRLPFGHMKPACFFLKLASKKPGFHKQLLQ